MATFSINVASPAEMQATIHRLIAQGFEVQYATQTHARLIKRKEFNIVIAVLGFLFLLLGLLIYLLIYATQQDQVVEIHLVAPPRRQPHPLPSEAPPLPWPALQLSPDGAAWWDGRRWVPTEAAPPPHAIRDNQDRWWDGVRWRQPPTPH